MNVAGFSEASQFSKPIVITLGLHLFALFYASFVPGITTHLTVGMSTYLFTLIVSLMLFTSAPKEQRVALSEIRIPIFSVGISLVLTTAAVIYLRLAGHPPITATISIILSNMTGFLLIVHCASDLAILLTYLPVFKTSRTKR